MTAEQAEPGPGGQVQQPEPQRYNTWLAGLNLSVIEIVRLHAERRLSGAAPATRYELGAGWTAEGDQIFWRYDVQAHLTDDEGSDYGDVQVSVLLRGEHREQDFDAGCIEQFGATSGTMMAHPFMREAVSTTALRLGFPGVMLPMITAQPDEPVELADVPPDTAPVQ